MTYEEARKYIEYTDTLGSVLGLDSTRELLRRLGNPQDSIKIVHIAGTNGKGSIFAFLESILRAGGYRVGRYISPTIFTYLERFQINGRYMDEDTFADYLQRVKDAADDMVADGWNRPTSFETETAISFCYFMDQKVDILLLETGMGGLLDSTNVIEKPLCTVIASISMDHIGFLGDTIEKIYSQKLGIMKNGVPCVSYPLEEKLMPQWIEKCEENGTLDTSVMIKESDIAICHNPNGDENVDEHGSTFLYRGEEYRLNIPGIYQIYNSVVAIETAEMLKKCGFDLKKVDIYTGLEQTVWRGRFQRIMDDPLVYVDGAHNPGGWKALRKNIDTYFAGRKLIYVCGVFKDKDYNRMLDIMMPGADTFIAVKPDNPRALDNKELGHLAKRYIDSVFVQDNVDNAVYQALDIAKTKENSVVLIFGSLSFIGPIIEKSQAYVRQGDEEHTYAED